MVDIFKNFNQNIRTFNIVIVMKKADKNLNFEKFDINNFRFGFYGLFCKSILKIK